MAERNRLATGDAREPAPAVSGRGAFFLLLLSTAALLGAVTWVLHRAHDPNLAYTRSLLIFVVPAGILGFWLWRRKDLELARKSFWWTVGPWTLVGFSLDFLLASRLFIFPRAEAVFDIPCVPIWGFTEAHSGACPSVAGAALAGAPVEEFIFYFTGFLAVLLTYIWADEVWLAKYNVDYYAEPAKSLQRILAFDSRALIIGALVLGSGWIYKNVFTDHPGRPLYLIFLVACAVVPSISLLRVSAAFVNWRAFGFTFFWIVLVSLIWEVTLALPGGYWGYQEVRMVGLQIEAWHDIPIEAILVWVSVSFATILSYEAVKIWQASGRAWRRAFVGS